MDLRTFWLGWRRDIFRLLALCLGAVAVAGLINQGKTRARHRIEDLLGARDPRRGGSHLGFFRYPFDHARGIYKILI